MQPVQYLLKIGSFELKSPLFLALMVLNNPSLDNKEAESRWMTSMMANCQSYRVDKKLSCLSASLGEAYPRYHKNYMFGR